jgi:RNA polymerase sigma factor (sigma-70 family)
MRIEANQVVSGSKVRYSQLNPITIQKYNGSQGAEHKFCPGNHADFTLAFHCFYKQLCLFSAKLVKDYHSGEDIVVEVFIKLWNTQGQFSNTASLKRWLYKCTYNKSLNYIKKRTYHADPDEGLMDNDNRLRRIINDEISSEVFSLVATLPRKCKSIIELYYFVGLEYQHIAKLFDISINTVKNQRVRGIYLIKQRLSASCF